MKEKERKEEEKREERKKWKGGMLSDMAFRIILDRSAAGAGACGG